MVPAALRRFGTLGLIALWVLVSGGLLLLLIQRAPLGENVPRGRLTGARSSLLHLAGRLPHAALGLAARTGAVWLPPSLDVADGHTLLE